MQAAPAAGANPYGLIPALQQGDVLSGVADAFGQLLLAQAVRGPQPLHGVGHTPPYRQVLSHRGGNYR